MESRTIPPLPAHTLALVLEYLSPLALPLPPHLLSAPLTQRHHFLGIAPDDPDAYLSWPSPDATPGSALAVLETLPRRADGGHLAYPVQYTADDESVCAHALCSAPGGAETARLVFHWDGADAAWKYHDLSTAPLPSPHFPTPADAVRAAAPISVPAPHSAGGRRSTSDDADDDYWNAYGGADDEPGSAAPRGALSTRSTRADKGEDAYWAQYAAVHGTADSTIPSPVPEKAARRPGPARPANPYYGAESPAVERAAHDPRGEWDAAPLPIPPHGAAFRVPPPALALRESGAPPSPNVLRRLLETIPPRSAGVSEDSAGTKAPAAPYTVAADDDSTVVRHVPPAPPILRIPPGPPILPIPPVTVALPVPPLRATASTASSGSGTDSASAGEDDRLESPVRISRTPTLPLSSRTAGAFQRVDGADGDALAPEDEDVRQAIGGLFRLWSANRAARTGETSLKTDAFIQVVRDAIGG